MRTRWGLVLAVLLALVGGFVTGWALRGDSFDVGAFEAVGTWVGALVSASAVVVALYLGYESDTERRKRDRQLDQDMTYTQTLLEGARRAQAGRVAMDSTGWHEGSTFTGSMPSYAMWSMMPRVTNKSDSTLHDLEVSLKPVTMADARPDVSTLVDAQPYLQPGQNWQSSLNIALAVGATPTDQSIRLALRFTDATGQRWNLDHQRRLSKVDE